MAAAVVGLLQTADWQGPETYLAIGEVGRHKVSPGGTVMWFSYEYRWPVDEAPPPIWAENGDLIMLPEGKVYDASTGQVVAEKGGLFWLEAGIRYTLAFEGSVTLYSRP